jgi:lipocalin
MAIHWPNRNPYEVLEQDNSIAFEGSPEEVEVWLFENTTKHNDRLRVKMGVGPVVPALEFIGA